MSVASVTLWCLALVVWRIENILRADNFQSPGFHDAIGFKLVYYLEVWKRTPKWKTLDSLCTHCCEALQFIEISPPSKQGLSRTLNLLIDPTYVCISQECLPKKSFFLILYTHTICLNARQYLQYSICFSIVIKACLIPINL